MNFEVNFLSFFSFFFFQKQVEEDDPVLTPLLAAK